MNPSKRKDNIDQETQEKELSKIIKVLKKLPLKEVEILKKLIERQMDFQSNRVANAQKEKKREAEEYFSGQVDLWDEIFQALEN